MLNTPRLDQDARTAKQRARRLLSAVIVGLYALVMVTPAALSSGDLYRWAGDPNGLGLASDVWRVAVFVALDAAALACVAITIYAAMRGDRAGRFKALVWVFAGGSALANYLHGQATPAPHDAVFFAAMSLLAPYMLDGGINKLRRWTREDDGEQEPSPYRWARWLPGVAFRESFQAWRLAARDSLSTVEEAVPLYRLRRLLRSLPEPERIAYAIGTLRQDGTEASEVHAVRVWLVEHGITKLDHEALTATISRLAEQRAAAAREQLEAADRAEVDLARRELEAAARDRIDAARRELTVSADAAVDQARADAARDVQAVRDEARRLVEQARQEADAARAGLLQEQGARRQAETDAATVKTGAEELLAARVAAETDARLARQDAEQARARLAALEAEQQAAAAEAAARVDQLSAARADAPADDHDGTGGRRAPRALTGTERRRVRAAHARGERPATIAERTGIALQPIRAYIRELDAKRGTGRGGVAHAPGPGVAHASTHAAERAPIGALPDPPDDHQPSMNGAATST